MTSPRQSGFDLLSLAALKLEQPPVPSRVVRPQFHGNVVQRFALPLELCQPQNRKRSEPAWASSKRKLAIRAEMAKFARPWSSPLRGRPQILCVRFSSAAPDRYADWAKEAVDVLQCPTKRAPTGRLGIISDDSDDSIDLHQWWEHAKPGSGFVYIEVRTGE